MVGTSAQITVGNRRSGFRVCYDFRRWSYPNEIIDVISSATNELDVYTNYTLPGRAELESPAPPPGSARLPHLVFFVPLQNAVHNRQYELSNDFDYFF